MQVNTRAVGCTIVGGDCYDLYEAQGGPELLTYSSAQDAGQPDGFWSKCSTSASFGRIRTSSAQASFGLALAGSASCSANATSFDSVVAGAPGVAFGAPMTYTAKATLSTSTPGTQAPYHLISLCISFAGQTACSDASGVVSVRVKTTAGSTLPLILQLDSSVRADKDGTPMSVSIDKLARLKLTANKADANITGLSSYTYR